MNFFEILMFGPAYGHNIKPFLDFFSRNTHQYKLTFIYSGKDDFAKDETYANIKFVKLSKNIFSILNLIKIIRTPFHLIWNHGAYNVIEVLLITIFKKKNTFFNVNIWGERIPLLLFNSNLNAKLYNYCFNKTDIIQLNWFGTEEIIKKALPNKKTIVFPWGLDSAYFETKKIVVENTFTQEFLQTISREKFSFFYPKSFSSASDHLSIIEASNILVQKGITEFEVFFWLGNVTDKKLEEQYTKKIQEYKLNNIVKIVKHPFLDFEDIIAIWKKMDAGLQIAINDQFSTTVIEPLLLKKDMIITDIYPYQKLIEMYPELELELTPLDTNLISEKMEALVNGHSVSETLLENRKKVIEAHFNFEKNLSKMLEFYIKETKFEA